MKLSFFNELLQIVLFYFFFFFYTEGVFGLVISML